MVLFLENKYLKRIFFLISLLSLCTVQINLAERNSNSNDVA